MADGDITNIPGAEGMPATLPDAPGDFSETVPNQQTAEPGKRAHPFAILTPAQEADERARLNFQAAHKSTLLGSAIAGDLPKAAEGLSPDQRASFASDVQTGLQGTGTELSVYTGDDAVNFDASQETAKDQLTRMQADQAAYDNMPAYHGLKQGLYSLAGQVAGGMASPENLVFPEVKLGSVAWRATHPLISDIIGYGLGQAAIQGPANIVTQVNQVRAGLKKEFDPVEASLALPTGFAFGGGLAALNKGGAALYRYGKGALEDWMLKGVPSGPTLTPEVRPSITPEPPRAPADTFEAGRQFVPGAVPPEAAAVSAGLVPEPTPGTIRLYRAAGPGDDAAKHVLFTPTQFPGANEFIDVPENVAARMSQGGDRVSLPADVAAVRQKLPEPTTPAPKPEEPSVFQNLTNYDQAIKIKKGEEPQTFTEWTRSMGGLKAAEPEIKDLELPKSVIRPRAANAKTAEQILEAAVQQKRLPEGSTLDDVYRILRDESTGTATHYHPGETAQAQAVAAKRDPELKRVMGEIDASLREMGEHPTQIKGRAAKNEARDIRNRAIEIAHTEGEHPEIAIERAMQEYGEHAAAAAGQPKLVKDHPEIPFDVGPAPREGGRAGEAGVPGGGANAPVAGGASPPSATEGGIAKRLKGMAGQGIGAMPGATRPAAGVAQVASANVTAPLTPLENLQQMMRRISAKLELVVRKGVHEKGALGQYDFETHIVRIKDMGPDGVVTWAHEVGHDVENRMGKPVRDLLFKNMQSMKAFAGDMGDGMEKGQLAREGFGEFMAGYITNRAYLERTDPNFVKQFRQMMAKENPELLATLDDANVSFERFNAAPSGQAASSIVVTHGEIPKDLSSDLVARGPVAQFVTDTINSASRALGLKIPSGSELYFKYVNKQHPMTIAVRSLARAYEQKTGNLLNLRPDEDPRLLAQVLGDSSFQKTVMDLTYGIQNMRDLKPEGPSVFSILRRVTANPLTGAEVTDPAEFLARRKAFDAYLIAKWHTDLRQQMQNGEITLNRMPTPLTDGDAALTIAETEKLHPDWVGLSEELYAAQKLQAKLEHEAGLRSSESYADIMHQRNHRYVPLYRDMSGINESLGVGGSFRGDKALEDLGMFPRQGSGRNILSPTESFMRRQADINNAANQNMIVTALRDLVQLVGGKEGAAIAEMIPNNQVRAMDINVNDAVYKAAKAQGWTTDDAKSLVRDLQQELGEDIRTKLFKQEALKAGNRPIVFGWENGERFAMRLPDGEFGRQLVNVMDSLGPKGMQTWAQAGGLMVDALTFTSSTLRSGATGTATFMAKNLLRDAFMQYLLIPEAGVDTLAMANAIRGGRSYLLGDEFYRIYTSLGGIRGGVGAAGLSRSSQQVEFERGIKRFTDQLVTEKSTISPSALQAERVKMAEAMGVAGVEPHKQIYFGNIKEFMSRMEISETAGRVGLFRAVYDSNIAMGRDTRYAMYDAAMKARDFIDYGRMGSRMEMWARLVPFLNANIQGIDKFIRTYAGTPSSPGLFFKPFTTQQAEYQQALRASLAPRVAAMAAVSAGITYVWEDDPVYQRLSVQQRSQNWIFRVPFLGKGTYDMLGGGISDLPEGMQGAWIFIPKPWEPGTIFNFAEKAVEFLNSGDTDHLTKALSSIRYTFSVPNPMELPLIRTGMGLASNYDDFFQRPIIPSSLQGVAPHLQANEYTNKFYVMIAEGLNLLPGGSQAWHSAVKSIPAVGATLAAPWSPMEAQYLMQGVFGDWPRELGGIGGIGRSIINGEMPKVADVPALRAFVKDRMAMGEPMSELYNQIGQNGGRLTVANKSFTKLVKDGDMPSALQYLNSLSDEQRDYVRMHQVQGGPLANVLHPLDNSSALASVTRNVKNGLLAEGGLGTLRDPNVRIKLEDGKRDQVIQALNEYTATSARNALIVQGASGFKNLPIVDTNPYLDMINKMSPELGKELGARLAQGKVMPITSIQQFWPQAQTALRTGSDGTDRLTREIKGIANQAGLQGYEGGGRKVGRGAVDSEGQRIKRGKSAPVALPAEQ